jgi:hypothetical protein
LNYSAWRKASTSGWVQEIRNPKKKKKARQRKGLQLLAELLPLMRGQIAARAAEENA